MTLRPNCTAVVMREVSEQIRLRHCANERPIAVELEKPVAVDNGTRFAIREGGRTVGSGIVMQLP